MENKAIKHDGGKPRFSLTPQLALDEVLKGFEHGAVEYGLFNYSKGMNYLRYYDAKMRHSRAWLKGEDIDESGIHHLALSICNDLMLLDNILTGQGIDDRNKIYQKKKRMKEIMKEMAKAGKKARKRLNKIKTNKNN